MLIEWGSWMCQGRMDPLGERKGWVDRTSMEKENNLEAGRGMAVGVFGRQAGKLGNEAKDNLGWIRLLWDKRQQGWATVQGW